MIDGELDGAHMLSGQPIGATIGFGTKADVVTAFTMDLNGNAITVSNAVWEEMKKHVPMADGKPVHPIKADTLKPVIEQFNAGGKAFNLGMVFPVSTHNYELRYWLAAGGINPDRDVKLVVVPPPLTSDALAAGAPAVDEELQEVLGSHRPGEQVALEFVHPHAPQQLELFGRGLGLDQGARQVGVARQNLALGSAEGEVRHRQADGDAGVAGFAGGAIGDVLAAAETRQGQFVIDVDALAERQVGEHLPLGLARQIGAGGHRRHVEAKLALGNEGHGLRSASNFADSGAAAVSCG